MTTLTDRMKRVAAFSASNVLEGLTTRNSASGSLIVERMPVFKSGTFKDSMGIQATWEPEHLEQMVFNFGMLRDRGTLPNVPVRNQHRSLFGGGGEVIGYVLALHHDTASGRLLADFEITEPDAAEKVRRGTYRARSAEIGMYETNEEALYWPVFMGFAFVDIPAVEGLYNKAQAEHPSEFIIMTEEDPSVSQKNHGAAAEGGASTETPPAAPATGTEQPPAAPAAPAAATGTEEQPPAAPEPQVESSEHSAPVAGAFSFSINGQPTTDFAAVQSHITALETAQREQASNSRKEYVNNLAKDRKITQPQVAGLQTLVSTLTDEQYESFCSAYSAAPTLPLLDAHAGGGTEVASPDAAKDDEIAMLSETIAMHTRAGIPQAQIEQMPSFIRLQALKAANTKE